MLKPARPYYHLWHDDHRLLSFDFPLLQQGGEIWSCQKKFWFNPRPGSLPFLFCGGEGGGAREENFILTSSILIGAQVAAKEPSSKPAEMLAGVA